MKQDDPCPLPWHSACCGDSQEQLPLFKASKITALIKFYTVQQEHGEGGGKGSHQNEHFSQLCIGTQAGKVELLFGGVKITLSMRIPLTGN